MTVIDLQLSELSYNGSGVQILAVVVLEEVNEVWVRHLDEAVGADRNDGFIERLESLQINLSHVLARLLSLNATLPFYDHLDVVVKVQLVNDLEPSEQKHGRHKVE